MAREILRNIKELEKIEATLRGKVSKIIICNHRITEFQGDPVIEGGKCGCALRKQARKRRDTLKRGRLDNNTSYLPMA